MEKKSVYEVFKITDETVKLFKKIPKYGTKEVRDLILKEIKKLTNGK